MRILLAAVCCVALGWGGLQPSGIGLARADGPQPARPPDVPAFQRPLPTSAPVGRPFEPPPEHVEYGPGHRGVDLIGDVGQLVVAAAEGTVVHAGWLVDRPLVSIEHAGGLRTSYEPVAPVVSVGQRVRRGEPIGHLEPGHPECVVPPGKACLHWGARHGRTYLDPLRLVGHGTVRLLPWEGTG